ncbi:MAG: hypothetical protein AAB221_15320, partial [Bacteroidota bacterium]
MVFKLRIIVLGMIFLSYFCVSVLPASELSIPLPQDVLKVSEESVASGPIKSLNKEYESSWDKKKLIVFYKKEMRKAGWMHKRNGSFVKNDRMTIITINSEKIKGKTGFIVSTFNMPSADGNSAKHNK